MHISHNTKRVWPNKIKKRAEQPEKYTQEGPLLERGGIMNLCMCGSNEKINIVGKRKVIKLCNVYGTHILYVAKDRIRTKKLERGDEPCTWERPKLPHPSNLASSCAKAEPQLLP